MKPNTKAIIFNIIDSIENKTNIMAHEIPELADRLIAWQDGKLKDSFFMATLTKYVDQLNNGE